ncbi:MAG: PBECR4 domain-containing protein [Sporolactobacillus sp.]
MEKQRAKDIILDAFQAYKKISDKKTHYVYLRTNEGYREIVLNALGSNFMHLCGVKYIKPGGSRPVSGNQFFHLLDINDVSAKGLQIRDDGTTGQKLQVIKHLDKLTSCASLRVIDQTTALLNFSFQAGIRSRKHIFCLALVNAHGYYAPYSFLNYTKAFKQLPAGYPVECIYQFNPTNDRLNVLSQTELFAKREAINPYNYQDERNNAGPTYLLPERSKGYNHKNNRGRGFER